MEQVFCCESCRSMLKPEFSILKWRGAAQALSCSGFNSIGLDICPWMECSNCKKPVACNDNWLASVLQFFSHKNDVYANLFEVREMDPIQTNKNDFDLPLLHFMWIQINICEPLNENSRSILYQVIALKFIKKCLK